jgi:hypothetical protein
MSCSEGLCVVLAAVRGLGSKRCVSEFGLCCKQQLTVRYVVVIQLQDLENTTGSWDMYGQDDNKRYPGMQNEFFNRAGDILKRREALRGFAALCECDMHAEDLWWSCRSWTETSQQHRVQQQHKITVPVWKAL